MVIRVGELRLSVELLRFCRGPLIDAGIEVDQMRADLARRSEVDHHVALAVEAAGVPHVGVVVGRHVDVVVLGPANTLQVNRHRRSRRTRHRCHLDDAGFDGEVGTREESVALAQRHAVQAAKIQGNRHRSLDSSIGTDLDVTKRVLLGCEAVAADATPDRRLP